MPRRVFEPHPGMSQAARSGNVICLAGQVGFDEGGELVGTDAAAQSEQIFRNIERLLAKAGGSLDDVIRLTCFLTDADQFPAYAEVKQRWFPGEAPASTSVIVTALLDPRLLLEVEAIAVVEP